MMGHPLDPAVREQLYRSGAIYREISAATGHPVPLVAVAGISRLFWAQKSRGGGLLFAPLWVWVLLWYVMLAWLAVKLAVWAAIMALLVLALAVTLAMRPLRGHRALAMK